MDVLQIVIFIAVGIVGGGWNALAGGATLFTFPALMAAGLPPMVANSTNYLALLPANAAALPAYRRELKAVGRSLRPLLVVSGAGAIVGALLLLASDPEVFVGLIPFLILLATGLFAAGDVLRRWLVSVAGEADSNRLAYGTLFLTSIYGGYFGAGLGIILLAIAQIMGFRDFHVANSIKNLLATSFTLLSILIFQIGGLIAWPQAMTMMVGSALGGYLGGRLARRVDQGVLRAVVVGFGVVLSAVYFFKVFG